MTKITKIAAFVLAIYFVSFVGFVNEPLDAAYCFQEDEEKDELERLILKRVEEQRKKREAEKAENGGVAPSSTKRNTRARNSRASNASPGRVGNSRIKRATSTGSGLNTTPAAEVKPIPRVRPVDKTATRTEFTEMKMGRNSKIDPNVRLKFNFEDEEWREVIDWFADQIGFGVFYGDTGAPTGTVSIPTTTEFTLIESLDFLNRHLSNLNPPHTLVRNGNQSQLIVVNESGGYPVGLIETIREENLGEFSNYEVASCSFDLGKLAGNVLANQLREDVSEVHLDGFYYVEAANQLIVRERVVKLRRIQEFINLARKRLDVVTVEAYETEFVEPDILLLSLRPMMGFADDSNVLDDGTLSMAVQPLGTKIFLKGSPERIDEFTRIAKLIDTEYIGEEGVPEKPYFNVTKISGDPVKFFQVAQTLLDGEPNVKLEHDGENLLVWGPKSVHDLLADALNAMVSDEGDSFKIIDLENIRPSDAVTTLENLLGIDPFAETATGPRLVADSDNDRIMVYATPQEIKQIVRMVSDIDKFDGSTEGPRRNSRMIQMSARQADDIIRMMETPGIMDAMTGRSNRLNLIMPKDRKSMRDRSMFEQRFPRSRSSNNRAEDEPQGSESRGIERSGSDTRSSARGAGGSSRGAAPRARNSRSRSTGSTTRHELPARKLRAVASINQPSFYVSTACQENPFYPDDEVMEEGDQIGRTTAEDEEDSPTQGYQVPEEKPSVPGAPVDIRLTEHGIIITSDDLDAADDVEHMIRDLINEDGATGLPSFFYLQFRKVSEVKTLLDNIFGLASSSGGGGGGGGIAGLVGSALENTIGGPAGGALGGLLGGGGGGGLGGSDGIAFELEGEDVKLSMDVRSNSLIVIGATTGDLEVIAEFIDLMDIDSPPQDPDLYGATYSIEVKFRPAIDVKEIVEAQLVDLFKVSNPAGGNRNQNAEAQISATVLRSLQGGNRRGGNRGGGAAANNTGAEQPKATLSVDEMTNCLIVTGPKFIYERVRLVVETLDVERRVETDVITPKAPARIVLEALKDMFPGQIVVPEDSEDGEGGGGATAGGGNRSTRGVGRGGGAPSTREQLQQNILNEIRRGGGAGGRGGGGGARGGGGGGRGGGGGGGRGR